MKIDIWSFILIALAVWRVGNMISDTDQAGPFGILDIIRIKAGMKYDTFSVPYSKRGSLSDMLTCIYCNTIWIGIIFYILWNISQTLTIIVSTPLALSAVAIFLQEWVNGRGKMG